MPKKAIVNMITAAQIRAARAALGWSALDLAKISGVGHRTIMRMEATEGVQMGRISTLMEVKSALELAGIEFLGSPDDRPGIRFLKNKSPEN
jgi:transcriptional regulator with XRE-family HTH domain